MTQNNQAQALAETSDEQDQPTVSAEQFLRVLSDLDEAGILNIDRIANEYKDAFRAVCVAYSVPFYAACAVVGDSVAPDEHDARAWLTWIDRQA